MQSGASGEKYGANQIGATGLRRTFYTRGKKTMKKVLLASTALILSAGFAAAEVTVGGDGRMGIADNFTGDLEFSSRIRIKFTASGETDSGLQFGGSVRADNSVDGTDGLAGSVYIMGSFGKLTMGDIDSAAENAVGDVDGVGYQLSGVHETTYITGDEDEGLLYEYSAGDLTFFASLGQREMDDEVSVGVKYTTGDLSFALGYEDQTSAADPHIVAGVTAGFGDVTFKAIYGDAGAVGNQYAASVSFTTGATTFTVNAADDTDLAGDETMGIGVAYDLGGGAKIKAGYVDNSTDDTTGYDLGITFDF